MPDWLQLSCPRLAGIAM